MSESIAFDRAVEYYDRTRALPAEIHDRFIGVAAGELGARPTLEIGVGTGRVGLSLVERGVPLVGLDLSRPMLDVLRSKGTLPVVEGDCVRLPFPAACFHGAVACMVLHLVPPYREALAELRRVVRPGGVVLASRGRPGGPWGETAEHFHEELGRPPTIAGAATIEDVDAAAAEVGFAVRRLPEVRWTTTFDTGAVLGQWERREFAGLWREPEEECRRAAAATRAWAFERFGAGIEAETAVAWHAYDR